MIRLNKEYAIRHLAAVAVFTAVSLWSCWDGAVRYPRENREWLARGGVSQESPLPHPPSKVRGQFIQAAALSALALVVAARLLCEARRKFDFVPSDVKELDLSRWESKRIAFATLSDGRRVKLDGWHFTGVDGFLKEAQCAKES